MPLENLACRENQEKTVPLVSQALREPKAARASLGSGVKMALRGGKGTLALQDFVVQQTIMMCTRKREMKEFQAHQGPEELVAHRASVVSLDFLEVLGHQGLASEERLDHPAWKEGKGNEDPREGT